MRQDDGLATVERAILLAVLIGERKAYDNAALDHTLEHAGLEDDHNALVYEEAQRHLADALAAPYS